MQPGRLVAQGHSSDTCLGVQAVQQLIDKLEKTYITPQRKSSFLCCAECCDRARDSQALQQWYVLLMGEN